MTFYGEGFSNYFFLWNLDWVILRKIFLLWIFCHKRGDIEWCVVIPISQCKQYKHNLITTVNSNMQITPQYFTSLGSFHQNNRQTRRIFSSTLTKHSSNGRSTWVSYLKTKANTKITWYLEFFQLKHSKNNSRSWVLTLLKCYSTVTK